MESGKQENRKSNWMNLETMNPGREGNLEARNPGEENTKQSGEQERRKSESGRIPSSSWFPSFQIIPSPKLFLLSSFPNSICPAPDSLLVSWLPDSIFSSLN